MRTTLNHEERSFNVNQCIKNLELIIVTGMSGSGKTQACKCLEDLGYFCVDNLPPILIPKFIELCSNNERLNKLVLVVDIRSRDFFDNFVRVIDKLKGKIQSYGILFIDASDNIIVRRYKETRRRHPLAYSSRISDGILKERKRLEKIRNEATYIIDTSNLSINELRDKINELFNNCKMAEMNIVIMSFGFKYGIPLDADMVLDVRFLPNPFYIPKLRHKSGIVEDVANYIESHSITREYLKYLDPFIEFLIPQYICEGKLQFIIAIGCTGGMHRSVFVAKHIYEFLVKKNYAVNIEHRDLMKNDVENVS